MKISKISIEDFRQYKGLNDLDLTVTNGKNLIILGGKNGFGKTNLLIGIVWCLYGDKITLVDENFKNEIQKEKNYSAFMQHSINWDAKKEGKSNFSVSIKFDEIDIDSIQVGKDQTTSIIVKRSRNVLNSEENISIVNAITEKEIFEFEEEKINFINDFLIPVDAAKFVFFDAEKISDIANLSIKEEGNYINDALSRVLGLDNYNTLIDDLDNYINNLKKESATKNLQEEIIDKERAIQLALNRIEELNEENAELLKKLDELKAELRSYDSFISEHSKSGGTSLNRNELILKKEQLQLKRDAMIERFNEFSELIPLYILTGKLEEVSSHLSIQEVLSSQQDVTEATLTKLEYFLERLFNKPPEPVNTTLSLKDKLFYYDKARGLIPEIFYKESSKEEELLFEHDLNNSQKSIIEEAIQLISQQSSILIEETIKIFNEAENELLSLNTLLTRVDSELEDELILEYKSKKDSVDYEITNINRSIGKNKEGIEKLNIDATRLNKQKEVLVKKVSLNKKISSKIRECEKYKDVLKLFIGCQKELHKNNLEESILSELKKVMHKLGSENNSNRFIEDVKVSILASSQGMKITLLDEDDNEIRKESLSSGEKQIYISCLIKAIINEANQNLPIFIDTPLGRLDQHHRDQFIKTFYPRLSEQVVLFSTDSEITPKKFEDISGNVSKSYLLNNDGQNTSFKTGYFVKS